MKTKPTLRFKYFSKDDFNWKDSEFLRELRSNDVINKEKFITKKITRIEQEYWWENDYRNDLNKKIWIVYDALISKSIGYATINIESLIHKRCTIDYAIHPDFRKNKYDIKIIKWLLNQAQVLIIDAHKVNIFVMSDDEKRLFFLNEKFNFEIECLLREHIKKDNKFCDVYLASKLIS